MLTLQHRQELISRAYVAAIAAGAGMNSSTRDLDYGIDLTLHQITSRTSRKTGKSRIVESGLTLDLQIKSTINAITEANCIEYDLDTNSYDDLRDNLVQTSRILVLHVQPSEEVQRIQHSREALSIGGCCYWCSLRGAPPIDNTSTIRIRIPIQQQFSQTQLIDIMTSIKQGTLH